MLSCLSVLKILSDTQQIFEAVNVQRGITLLTLMGRVTMTGQVTQQIGQTHC